MALRIRPWLMMALWPMGALLGLGCGGSIPAGQREAVQLAAPHPIVRPTQGGIALTFDDHAIGSWAEADAVLRPKYQWSATFFVDAIARISDEDARLVRNLYAAGHDVGCHGLNHLNAVEFLKSHTMEEYLAAEIQPAMEAFRVRCGLVPESFAFPYGAHNSDLDLALGARFKRLRGAGKLQDALVQAPSPSLIMSVHLDATVAPSWSVIQAAMDEAKATNRVLVMVFHTVVETPTGPNQVSLATLDRICAYAKSQGLAFVRLHDLT
jgi:peptidoglycan/xylan/chitin deacetylase (PgdA/CDA1 family)